MRGRQGPGGEGSRSGAAKSPGGRAAERTDPRRWAGRGGRGTIAPRSARNRPPDLERAPIRSRRTWLLALLAAALTAAGAGPAAAALPYVAVDAGHGGADTGAVGGLPAGTVTGLTPRVDDQGRTVLYEKDVNLDIAVRLQAVLTSLGARTLMTRTTDLGGGDRSWPTVRADLKARTDIANEARVDVFVAVLGADRIGVDTFSEISG